ncbi:MAG: 50S ribosomal protein L4 [Chloroflexaceae bacterium]|nr:50S ribosomal protein L4 [Chloroflexaceae bacterium]
MEVKLYNQHGVFLDLFHVSDDIFGIEPNMAVMHQAMVRQRANARLGTHNTRGRGEVRGSTRKLYRQKGTGRARQGSNRAPHRRGGGIAHGPHPRSYAQKMPRKMRRLAVRSALSAKHAAEQIRFVDGLELERPRTKDVVALLDAHGLSGKTLIVLGRKDETVQCSANNLPYVKTLLAHYLNVIDLLRFDNILMLRDAVLVVEGYLGNGRQALMIEDEADEEIEADESDVTDEADEADAGIEADEADEADAGIEADEADEAEVR